MTRVDEVWRLLERFDAKNTTAQMIEEAWMVLAEACPKKGAHLLVLFGRVRPPRPSQRGKEDANTW